MTLHRTHILLEPEQQKLLAEIARREGRSVSELARDIIQQGLEQKQRHLIEQRQRRLAALENAQRVGEAIRAERGGKVLDIDIVETIQEMREQRDEQNLGHRD